MRNNFSSDDHDPGDEDPTECVKRALLALIPGEVLMQDQQGRLYRVTPGPTIAIRTPAQMEAERR